MDKSYEAINEFLNNPQNTDDFYENYKIKNILIKTRRLR